MSKIVFTTREIERAWRNNYLAYEKLKNINTNTHRLMLFYAVECGLKAIIMKREEKRVTDSTITELGHNINEMLDKVKANKSLNLPTEIILETLKSGEQRNCHVKDINQMWRYGHLFTNKNLMKNDQTIEEKMLEISVWIKQELSGI